MSGVDVDGRQLLKGATEAATECRRMQWMRRRCLRRRKVRMFAASACNPSAASSSANCPTVILLQNAAAIRDVCLNPRHHSNHVTSRRIDRCPMHNKGRLQSHQLHVRSDGSIGGEPCSLPVESIHHSKGSAPWAKPLPGGFVFSRRSLRLPGRPPSTTRLPAPARSAEVEIPVRLAEQHRR